MGAKRGVRARIDAATSVLVSILAWFPSSTQPDSSVLREGGGVGTEGGMGGGINAATSVLIPILAFLWLSPLSLFRAFSGRGGRGGRGGSEARGGSRNRCSNICSGSYPGVVVRFSVQLFRAFSGRGGSLSRCGRCREGGVYTDGGVAAGIDAVAYVLVPFLALLSLSTLNRFRPF